MDPHQNLRGSRGKLRGSGRLDPAGGHGAGYNNSEDGAPVPPVPPESGQQQPADREPQHSGAFTVIPPIESRRSKLVTMGQKEEEDFKRWKEANRPSSVHLNPEKLGGNVTLAAAREKQFADLRSSKLQKKLRKEELDRMRRREEEEELQKMKAVQREKAEQLEERRRQEEQRRRERHRQDHLRATESFVQRFERTAQGPLASSSATHTSSRAVRKKEANSEQDVQLEHRRVNASFLDRLEGRGRGSETDITSEESNVAERPPPPVALHPDPGPEQSCSDWMQDVDSDPDDDWALSKLRNCFPNCCKAFLEDILDQCNGDHDQAYALLLSTLS